MSNEVGGNLQFIGTVEESSVAQSENVTATSTTVTTKKCFSIGQRWNPRYLTSRSGILKLLEMTISILCMACLPANRNVSSFPMLVAVAAVFFVFNFIWYAMYAFSLWSIIPNVPVKTMDSAYCFLASVCYLIISMTHLILNNEKVDKFILEVDGFYTSYIVAGVFGVLNAVLYGMDGFLLYRQRNTMNYGATISST